MYLLRVEINKIGSNVNQIANYTNFLGNRNSIETQFYVRYSELQIEFEKQVNETRKNIATIKVTFKKVNKIPFIILMSEKSNNNEVIEKTIRLKKPNEGWKLCDYK